MVDLIQQIQELEKKRDKLVEQAHDEAYKKAEDALAQLNALGYNYRLTGGTKQSEARESTGTRTRRSGIREDVYKTLSTRKGMSSADLAKTLGMDDKKGKQAIANVLSALKKADKITLNDGVYRVAEAPKT